ncbi:MAG: hypothetical protein ACI9Y7_001077 [Dokdonia sp.]|jgi:hypothetical protein
MALRFNPDYVLENLFRLEAAAKYIVALDTQSS